MQHAQPKRLVCVVEGKGEVRAIPNLCARVLKLLDVSDWFVDPEPIRQPRSRLVDERVPSPLRPATDRGFEDAIVQIDAKRDAKGLLRRYVPGYRPNLHQLEITRELDLRRCWSRSESFDKLVRSLAGITSADVPPRPAP